MPSQLEPKDCKKEQVTFSSVAPFAEVLRLEERPGLERRTEKHVPRSNNRLVYFPL